MRNFILTSVAVFFVATASGVSSGTVTWEFPRIGSCHEGLAFSDGVTGALVWGGGNTINLTVGRSDLWDHRGGYPWLESQNYSNIVALVQAGKKHDLLSLFEQTDVPVNWGGRYNPYMLPLGRVVLKLRGGVSLVRGELDPFTGLGKLFLSDGRMIEIAMSKRSRLFAMKFDEGLSYSVETLPAFEAPKVRTKLEPRGFKRPVSFKTSVQDGESGGFRWKLPTDRPVTLVWQKRDSKFCLNTGRGANVLAGFREFERIRDESVTQWRTFWEKGARVKVPDETIQRIFDYGMYRFGAMTDPDGVPAGLQGPWLEDDELVPWNGDYHFNINVQECYSPAYRGGHFENLMPLFRMVLSWRPLLRDNARKFVGIDNGYVLPHSVDDRGTCIGGFWTGTIDHASAAWVAAMMYRYIRYSGDLAFLRSDAYDFMKGAMNVYLAMMEEKDGRLSIPLAPSPEWGASDVRRAVGRDPSFQLAAAHRLARDLIDAAGRLGEKPDSSWLDVERRLPEFTSGPGGIQLFEGQPFVESHRHHSHLAGIYPFDTLDLGNPTTAEIVRRSHDTWVKNGTGCWVGWCVPWAAILNIHLGYADAARFLLGAWDTFYCDEGHGSHHDACKLGFTSWHRGSSIMQMDGQCAAATAVMEMMAHEVNGKVEFFKGCPTNWRDVSFENLALSDGRRVSGRRIDGIVSIYTNDVGRACVGNRETGAGVRVRRREKCDRKRL